MSLGHAEENSETTNPASTWVLPCRGVPLG